MNVVPKYNRNYYESVDWLGCISKLSKDNLDLESELSSDSTTLFSNKFWNIMKSIIIIKIIFIIIKLA